KEIWYNKRGDTIRVDVNGRTLKKIEGEKRLIKVVDEKGNTTTKKFNEHGSPLNINRSGVSETSFEYTTRFNQVSQAADPRGIETRYVHDLAGNLIEKQEGIGAYQRKSTYTYDSDNQMESATIQGDQRTESVTALFTHDDAGNISSITDPMGGVTRIIAYNNMGSPEKIQDRRGNLWELAYDDMGRLIS
ncbi:MAG: hypothetical protein GY854_08145, partial [Deltaproteobacteria bacterium]|nr:hypothetical protein [Deltaproteobacteria bacterium]